MTKEDSFSFFPDPEEQRYFREASVVELGETIENQPDFIARIIHETKRQGNGEYLHLALQFCIPLVDIEPNAIKDALVSAVFMCSEFNRPREEAKRFILDTLETLIRLENRIGVETPLGPSLQENITSVTKDMMDEVELGIKLVKARLN